MRFHCFSVFSQASCRFERPVANALEQFKQLKPTHEMFDSCRNCGALQEGHENASERVLPKASRGVQSTAKHESSVVVEDKGLSDLRIGIIYNEAHDSHDDHDENDGWNDQDEPRMSHHLFIEPHRRCVRTVVSPCQGYM